MAALSASVGGFALAIAALSGGGAAGQVAVASVAPVVRDSISRWRPFVTEASARFGVPVAWIERVMRAESGGQARLAGRPITSPAGAMGLMQLMPATWAELRRAHDLGDDPHDPRANILAGTAYLRAMYDRFGYPGLFAAYNAGPARYAAYLAGRQRLPAETRNYLAVVAGRIAQPVPTTALAAEPAAPLAALFVIQPSSRAAPIAGTVTRADPSADPAATYPAGDLFVVRHPPR